MRWQVDRVDLFYRDEWTCQSCGKPILSGVPQLAHRIGQTKANLKLYGKEFIHHPLNMASVCSLRCNANLDISRNPAEVAKLIEAIRRKL